LRIRRHIADISDRDINEVVVVREDPGLLVRIGEGEYSLLCRSRNCRCIKDPIIDLLMSDAEGLVTNNYSIGRSRSGGLPEAGNRLGLDRITVSDPRAPI